MNLARRNLLRGIPVATPRPLRPPGAIDEARFTEQCTACHDCIDACPQAIIVRGSGGFPEIDFGRAECTFCGECAAACQEEVLLAHRTPPWSLTLEVKESCLAKQQIVCNSCADACEPRAIRFPLRLGAVAEPEIDTAACTGCGACITSCPQHALEALAYD